MVGDLWESIVSNGSPAARWATTAAVIVLAVGTAAVVNKVLTGRIEDSVSRYHARKVVRYAVALVALMVVAVVWRAFAGNAGVVLGLAAAGLAFAAQEVIGALCG